MDTSRIVINIIDQSTSLIENPTAITGFTVVKAPKGPKTPLRVRSGAAAAIKDIFGESSQKYPELFEAETFNKEYDLWISAPYTKATVPVAYITNDGVVVGSKNIEYTDALEKVVLGEWDPEVDEVSISGLNEDLGDIEGLFDTRYPLSQKAFPGYDDVFKKINNKDTQLYKAADLDKDKYAYPDYKDGKLLINLGVPLKYFAEYSNNAIPGTEDSSAMKPGYKPVISKFKIKGLSSDYSEDFEIQPAEPAATTGTNANKTTFTILNKGKNVGYIEAVTNEEDSGTQLTNLVMTITGYKGEGEAEGAITPTYITTALDTDYERSFLTTFFVGKIEEADIHGAIIPKYPSDRSLHIEFSAFSDLKNYSASSWKSRNILKMDVYEDEAFHDENHKIHFEGSLVQTEKDANGAKIGFTEENGTYAAQHLAYVFTINPFTSEDTDKINKKIEKYPSITLKGGTREFEDYYKTSDEQPEEDATYYVYSDALKDYVKFEGNAFEEGTKYYVYEENPVGLHDLGWELSAEGDYTDVDIFFNSSLSHENNWSDSRFYTLAKVDRTNHKLAGYYFNKTLTPGEVDAADKSKQLSFGRNYWNIDNEAIIILGNGSKILSPLTGAMACMECRILENRWGGLAPMWENSGAPSMGGQLNSVVNIYKLKYRYTKGQLDILDDLNFNPVVNDRQYGFMVVGQKTCQPGDITDWSYIGHAAAFLNFLKEVRTNVMIPQIGKANNPYYRTLRKEQVERRLANRLEGNNRIWAWAEVDTSTADGVNDVFARKAKKFVINVQVMVDTFSEKVELNFTNLDQDSRVNFE